MRRVGWVFVGGEAGADQGVGGRGVAVEVVGYEVGEGAGEVCEGEGGVGVEERCQ